MRFAEHTLTAAVRPPIVLAALGVLLAGCGGGGSSASGATGGTAAPLFDAPAARDVNLVFSDLKYSTTRIEAASGEVLELRLSNTGSSSHDFTVKAMEVASDFRLASGEHAHTHMSDVAVHADLKPGQQGTLRVKPLQAGEYTFYCTVAGHRAAGMEGTLVVH